MGEHLIMEIFTASKYLLTGHLLIIKEARVTWQQRNLSPASPKEQSSHPVTRTLTWCPPEKVAPLLWNSCPQCRLWIELLGSMTQTQNEGHSKKPLACSLHKHHHPKTQGKLRSCSRLKDTKETWQLTARCNPGLGWDRGSHEGGHWENWNNVA